ncbi:MAG TPA: integrase core domain-containing protein [Candidatus Baltobacteraceae bacterium]|nr:integrase core domain-containing protein [Candidatus Baltobacteraceae bacterium]
MATLRPSDGFTSPGNPGQLRLCFPPAEGPKEPADTEDRFTQTQIVAILRDDDARASARSRGGAGLSATLKVDNGLNKRATRCSAGHTRECRLQFIEPAVRWRTAASRAPTGAFATNLMNEHAFPTIFDARSAIEAWCLDYNFRRPHTFTTN